MSPHDRIRLIDPLSIDLAFHAAEFAVFYLLAWRATGRSVLAIVLSVVYAGTDELHQAFVPARTASAIDFGCDVAGALLAAFVTAGIARMQLLGRFCGLILARRDKERG